jgi:hypothetical protein
MFIGRIDNGLLHFGDPLLKLAATGDDLAGRSDAVIFCH